MTMDEAERRILGLESMASETKEKLDTILYPLLRRIAADLQAGKLSDVNQEDYLSLLSAGGVFPVCQTERS